MFWKKKFSALGDRRRPKPPHPTRTLAAVVAVAFTCLTALGSPASAATTLADCTAALNPQYASWTAQCTAPHPVSIRMDRQWYWLGYPGDVHTSSTTFSHQVEPGTPWNERLFFIPETITVQLCLTAFQDSTVQITPRICSFRA